MLGKLICIKKLVQMPIFGLQDMKKTQTPPSHTRQKLCRDSKQGFLSVGDGAFWQTPFYIINASLNALILPCVQALRNTDVFFSPLLIFLSITVFHHNSFNPAE